LVRLLLIGLVIIFTTTQMVSAHGTNHSDHVETDIQTISTILIAGSMSSLIPLVFGFLSYYEIKKRELLMQDGYLISLGFSFGVLIFLLFDYASLSTLFAFRIENIIFQTVKMFIFIALFIILTGLITKDSANSDIKLFYIWVFGIVIHTIGEGIIMGHNLTQGITVAFVPLSVASFMMHKFVEGGG